MHVALAREVKRRAPLSMLPADEHGGGSV
jgi:hypothetical protein